MATLYAGEMPPARKLTPELVFAGGKLWCFRVIKALIGLGYVVVITEGLRMVVPALGIKLHSMPLLGGLRDYEGWHELELAPFAAVLVFLFSSSIWGVLIESWLYDDSALGVNGRTRSCRHRRSPMKLRLTCYCATQNWPSGNGRCRRTTRMTCSFPCSMARWAPAWTARPSGSFANR